MSPDSTSASGVPRLDYLHGFAGHHQTEAEPGALPRRQNSPQRAPLGLYAEQHSGTAFTEPRAVTRRTWSYRIRPSVAHTAFRRRAGLDGWQAAPSAAGIASPNRLRWNPPPVPAPGVDFLDGIQTYGTCGDVGQRTGVGSHWYAASASMTDRYMVDADGELLIVPQAGPIMLLTEFGRLVVSPGEFAVICRGVRFRVDLLGETASGYVLENYGAALTLPDLGPIGANGLADARHFRYPTAWYEDREDPVELWQRFGGRWWSVELDHSPLDVVAWHGNHAAYVFDLDDFCPLNTALWDHPDPSVFTVLTSPGPFEGQANADFAVFGDRWVVAEDTYRPPHFHRNQMSEFMGLVRGSHDSKAEGFVPGGASLHNQWSAHGADRETFEMAGEADLVPQKLTGSLPFMFETRLALAVTDSAMVAGHRQPDYDSSWTGIERRFRRG